MKGTKESWAQCNLVFIISKISQSVLALHGNLVAQICFSVVVKETFVLI